VVCIGIILDKLDEDMYQKIRDFEVPGVKIDSLGGKCPIQGYGTVDGVPFYFKGRGEKWVISVGDDPLSPNAWSYTEPYGDEPFAAGWISEDEALDFIRKGVKIYRTSQEDA
jgi:hypothetical protein